MEFDTEKDPLGNVLESFSRLEERALALGRRYQGVLEEREALLKAVADRDQALAELEARLKQQEEAFAAVDRRVAELLTRIDACLPADDQDSAAEQVLPGMNGS
jgi:chromosome segregation ATPase